MAQRYTSEELIQRELLLLLPYYLMRYEQSFEQIASDSARTASLLAECAELRADLEELTLQTGDTILYEELVELIIQLTDHMLTRYDTLRKKVRRAMGGEVLELWRDRVECLEREAKEQGLELGLEQGLEQGLEKGITDLSEQLRERGVDGTLIDEAIAAIKVNKD